MSKSALYAANTAVQTVATGGTINLGTPVRRFGCNCNMSGGNVVLNGAGYYGMSFMLSVEGTTAGTAIIQVYRDGAAVTGAVAEITTVADSIANVTIPCVVRNTCCCESNVTVVLTGVGAAINNASVVVEKL